MQHPATRDLNIACIGLGTMGFPIAGHLATRGYSVTVYNRTASKATAWGDRYPGTIAADIPTAVQNADLVITCVGNDDDLFAVTLGETGAFSAMRPGAILIDHTTASAVAARQLDQAAQAKGLHSLDAPVSGGQSGAEAGSLTVMVGGAPDIFAQAQPIIATYAKAVTHMGAAGSGQLTKMVNQICLAGLIQGLAEGLAFAENANLDAARVVDVISQGAAQSWQMDNRAHTMLNREFDFGFAVNWMRKDLAICQAEAARNGSQIAIAQLVDSLYAQIQQQGGGQWDTSSLIQLLGRGGKG